MMQRCVASISRGQSLSMARRWLPALTQRDFATAQRKGMRIGFFSAHNYEIGAMKALADHAGIVKDNELVFFSNCRQGKVQARLSPVQALQVGRSYGL
ncbi:hypothetical protein PRIC1_003528 [Phytophthora ramorum]